MVLSKIQINKQKSIEKGGIMKNLYLRKIFIFILMFAVFGFGYLMNYEPTAKAITAEETRMQNGVSFSAKETYDTVRNLEEMPKTFEAYFHLPTSVTSRAGLLFGNYTANTSLACFTFEIHWDGTNKIAFPKLYYDVDNQGATNPSPFNLEFKTVDVRSDDYIHLVITHDTDSNIGRCYINGELVAEKSYAQNATYGEFEFAPATTTGVGGDYRTGNSCAFQGTIKSLAFYTDVRTASEVKADYNDVKTADTTDGLLAPEDLTDTALLAAYDLTQAGQAYLNDLSKNGYDLVHADDKGITFKGDTKVYELVKKFEKAPQTFEAEIYIPKETNLSRPGVIIGTYPDGDSYPNLNFELSGGGKAANVRVRYTYIKENGGKGTSDFTFNIYDKLGQWIHIAVVHAADAMYFYVNGAEVSKQTYSSSKLYDYNPAILDKHFCLGGDYRAGNAQNFKYSIRSIKLYSDARTASEIVLDYRGVANTDDENLLALYKFNAETVKDEIKDLSGNGYHVYNNQEALNVMNDGLQFNSNESYSLGKKFTEMPKTVEAEVYIPVKYSGRGGVVLGNYGTGKSLAFEIYSDGKPRIFYSTLENGAMVDKSYVFDCDVRTGTWAHVTFVIDEANQQTLVYIDGKLAGKMGYAQYNLDFLNTAFVLGGDTRAGNEQNFKGLIRNVAVYSDVRTADEIALDAKNGTNLTSDHLLAAYTLTPGDKYQNIQDLTSNGYNIIYQDYDKFWFSEKEPVKDYAYSFAVVGDTQIVCQKYPDEMSKIYDWILANQESKNIQHVFGLGDVTNGNTSTEWAKAHEVMSKMDGKLSYSVVRGNHESSDMLNRYFNYEAYTSQFDGFYTDSNIDSTYMTMRIGSTDYLFITLSYGASDEELAWASSVVEAHPCHRVIVSTHAYLFRDGTTLDSGDVCPPADSNDANNAPEYGYNHGQQIWEKFVSQHENIFLVLSGHDPCDNVVTTQTLGVNGNLVTQMLIDPQGMDASIGATGMVAMLYFNEEGTEFEIEFYSTIRDEYYKITNQYTVEIPANQIISHDLGDLKETLATCEGTGLAPHYQCAGCGLYYDVNKNEVEYSSLVINALGHAYGQPTYEWSSDNSSCVGSRVCLTCGDIEMVNGTVSKVVDAPTCANNGLNTYTATFGNEAYETQVKTELVPSTGEHVYVTLNNENEHWNECGCGAIEADSKVTHAYNIAKNNENEHWNECSCGRIDGKVPHNWDSGLVTTKPTCTTDGEKLYSCACGRTKIEVLPMGHKYGEWVEEVLPTCTSQGLKSHYYCSECDKYFDETKAEVSYESLVTTLAHSYYQVAYLPAGCEEVGMVAHYECMTCDTFFDISKNVVDKSSLEITAKGHMYGPWIEGVLPTCEESGFVGHYECTRCGKYFDAYKAELTNIVVEASNDHPFANVWEFDENRHWHSSTCSHEVVKDSAPHDWDSGMIIVEATCNQPGVKVYYCTVCGTAKSETLPMTAHRFTVYNSMNNATCTANGTMVADCDYGCGTSDVVVELDSMLDHSYTTIAYDKDYHWHQCVCGDKEEVSAHEFIETEVIVEATEDTQGAMLYTCSCGQTKVMPIDKLAGAPDTIQEVMGCDGSIFTSIFGLIALTGAVIFVKKRKED